MNWALCEDRREPLGVRDQLGRLIYKYDLVAYESKDRGTCITRVMGLSRWLWGWVAIEEAWDEDPDVPMIINAETCVIVSPDLTNYERYMADIGTTEQIMKAYQKICLAADHDCDEGCPLYVICDMTDNGADGWLYETDWQTSFIDYKKQLDDVWQKYAKSEKAKRDRQEREYARSNLKKFLDEACLDQRRSNSFVEGVRACPDPAFNLRRCFFPSTVEAPRFWEGTD